MNDHQEVHNFLTPSTSRYNQIGSAPRNNLRNISNSIGRLGCDTTDSRVIEEEHEGETLNLTKSELTSTGTSPTSSIEIDTIKTLESDCSINILNENLMSNLNLNEFKFPEDNLVIQPTFGTDTIESNRKDIYLSGYEELVKSEAILKEMAQYIPNKKDAFEMIGFEDLILNPSQSESKVILSSDTPETFKDIIKETLSNDNQTIPEESKTTQVFDTYAKALRRMKTCEEKFVGDDIYKMTSWPRGYCVIINNVSFKVGCFDVRHGSDAEAEYLRDVYCQLGFKVKYHKNLCTERILQALKAYARAPELHKHDAFICIVLTHGDSRVLVGSNGRYLNTETVVGCFNNFNCPALINKPKMFFIQACRGSCRDFGVLARGTVADAVPRSVEEATKNHFQGNVIPSWTDTLIVHSTVEGFVSMRNELSGSWFGDALGEVLIENACNKEIYQLLQEVNKKIQARQSSQGIKQSIECIFRGWNKQLYFNPGHFEIKPREFKLIQPTVERGALKEDPIEISAEVLSEILNEISKDFKMETFVLNQTLSSNHDGEQFNS